ncbi:MAG: hypothetical protein IIA45_10280 [Bacteroidetes bacterium]|nr:hypothetical protein [Bacteroidota bacterium]
MKRAFVNVEAIAGVLVQIDDLLVVILAILIVVSLLDKKSRSFSIRRTYLDPILITLMLMFIISTVLNGSSLFAAVLNFKNFYLYYVLYYFIIYANFDVNKNNRVTKFIIWFFMFEFVVQCIQMATVVAGGQISPDAIRGTFGGAGAVSYMYFMPLFFLISSFILTRNYRLLPFIVIFVFGFIISFGMFAVITLPFLLIIYFIRKLLFSVRGVISFAASIIVLVGFYYIANILNPYISMRMAFEMYSPEKLRGYILEHNVQTGENKWIWFPLTYQVSKRFAYHPFVGMGPGMYGSHASFQFMSEPTDYIYNFFGQDELGNDPAVGSEYVVVWGELGYLGLGIFFIIFVAIGYHNFRIFKRSREPDVKALAVTASAAALFMIGLMYLHQSAEAPHIMCMFLLFTALSEREWRKEKRNRLTQLSEA